MAGYSGLDFGSVHDELGYWLGHTTSYFKGGFSGSGENGNDFSMPTGTPVYAIASGTVVGSGYYGGGGVVSIQQHPGTVWYYQHLDENVAQAGQFVNAGELIGYSGGQNSGGNHPSSPTFSGYQHIEVGIDAPWGGIWGGGANVGPNIDPRPALEGMYTATATGNTIPTGTNGTRGDFLPPLFLASNTTPGPSGQLGLSATQDAAATAQAVAANCQPPTAPVWDTANFTAQWAAYLQCQAAQGVGGQIGQGVQAAINATGIGPIATFFADIAGNWQADLGRVVKFFAGWLVIIASLLIFILPDAADIAISAAGAPELGDAVRQGLAHPFRSGPQTIKRGIRYSAKQRIVSRQQAFRGYRYAREAQTEEVRRQQVQQFKAQRGKATPVVLDTGTLMNGPAAPDTSQERVKPEDLARKPGLSRFGFHAGTTSEKNIFDELAKAGFPKRAAPTTQPLATDIPQRAPKTGMTFPETLMFWRRQGRRGVPTLVRQGPQQPGPIVPPPVEQTEVDPALRAKRAEQFRQMRETLQKSREQSILESESEAVNKRYQAALASGQTQEALDYRKRLLEIERELKRLQNG